MEWPITLNITREDILAAQKSIEVRSGHSLPDSPVLNAIERTTGSRWIACGLATLKEEGSPHRVIVLSRQLRHATRHFFMYGHMDPCSSQVWLTQ